MMSFLVGERAWYATCTTPPGFRRIKALESAYIGYFADVLGPFPRVNGEMTAGPVYWSQNTALRPFQVLTLPGGEYEYV